MDISTKTVAVLLAESTLSIRSSFNSHFLQRQIIARRSITTIRFTWEWHDETDLPQNLCTATLDGHAALDTGRVARDRILRHPRAVRLT